MRPHAWQLAGLILMSLSSGHTAGADGPLISDADIDGDRLTSALGTDAGDAVRGAQLFASRDGGHCVLCHAVSSLDAGFQGNVGPALDGVGSRYDLAQLRLRVADIRRLSPDAIMPSYYRITGLNQIGTAWQGDPVLSGQEIEDITAYLLSLKTGPEDEDR